MVAAGEASEKGRERESERQRRLKEILWNVRGVVWVEEYGKTDGRTSGRAAADEVNCTSGRNGRNKINAVEGVMLFFWYTVGNIINIPSIPCY